MNRDEIYGGQRETGDGIGAFNTDENYASQDEETSTVKRQRSRKKDKTEKLRQKRTSEVSEPDEEAMKQPKSIVDKCIDKYLATPRPRMLGFNHCFWYTSKNEPLIVIGPDWAFSLVKIVIMNILMGGAVRTYGWEGHE